MADNHKIRSPKAMAVVLLLVVSLGACAPSAEPTPSLDEIATSAYLTFSAEMATADAMATSTYTPAPSPTTLPTLPPPSPLPTIGLSTSAPAAEPATNCDDAAYIADVTVPDNTNFNPGERFSKTWRVQNIGTCAWTTSYKLTFLDGLKMDGTDSFVPLAVPVGQQADLSVDLAAPTSPGQYYGRWQLQNANEQPFGSILTVVVKVIPLSEITP